MNPADLTPEEAAVMDALSAEVTAAMNTAMRAIRTAVEGHQGLALHAQIAWFVSHYAGQLAARGEFIAINAGGSRKDVSELCAGSFQDGRSHAWAQAEAAGGIIQTNAPTTGAAQ
ncbi:hypothetical protein [Xanthobacter flavus]|uniref:hypothetical protein n=1 Tax=Xanthobacter flavus TaxID=281 RepID=UPI003728865C